MASTDRPLMGCTNDLLAPELRDNDERVCFDVRVPTNAQQLQEPRGGPGHGYLQRLYRLCTVGARQARFRC